MSDAYNTNKQSNMSCGEFKLIGYANLNNILIKEHGENSTDYLVLSSLVKDKVFLDIVEERGINIKKEGRKAYNALLEARALKTRSIEDINNVLDKDERGAFATLAARREAVDYASSIIFRLHYDSIYYGEPYNNFQEMYTEVQHKIINDGIARGKALFDNNQNNETIVKAWNLIKTQKDNTKRLNMLVYYLAKLGTPQDYNYAMMIASLNSNGFIEELTLRKNIANLIKKDDIYQTIDTEELGGYITEDALDGNEDSLRDSASDTMTQLWNLNIGEKRDFMDHVEEVVKYHISTLPILNSAVKKDNGKYDFNTDNLLGTVRFADSNFITQLLYSSADTSNVDNFITSLKKLSETIPGAECLIYLYDVLNINKAFANKYMMVFNKPIISKIEVYIQDGKLYNRITNPNTSKRNVIINRLFNSVKSNYANDKLDKGRSALLVYRKIPNMKTLWDYFHAILPDIDNDTFKLAVANLEVNSSNDAVPVGKRGMQEMANAITEFAKTISNGTKQYNTFINNFNKLTQDEKANVRFPDSFIDKTSTSGLYNMANILEPVMQVSIELNSRNAEHNLSSDIINRSYITNISDIIKKDKENTAISYTKQKFKSRQYDNSNLLLEHRDENGNIINYGLFRKVGDEYKLTEYAKDIFNIDLYNGISDHDTNNSDMYNSMSDGDYLITALGLFISQTRTNDAGIDTANYLLPIPSDAPKNFTITAPRYRLDNLRTTNEDGSKSINPNTNHLIFQQYHNIVLQELTNMAQAINKMFVLDDNGYPKIVNGEFEMSQDYKDNPDAFYELYFGKKNKVLTTIDGHKELTGNIFKFKRLKSKSVSNDINNIFNKLIGFEGVIDLLYGGQENGIKLQNGELILNSNQQQAIKEAIATWLNEYINNSYDYIRNKYSTFLEGTVTNAEIVSFLVNDYLVRDSMYDMFGGDQSFYKDSQAILKRIKEIQASGNPFGITDFTRSGIDEPITVDTVTIGNHKIEVKDKFTAVTVSNTVKNSNKETVDRIRDQLKRANIDNKTIDRILKPFTDPENKTATNDAQSYITVDEWIRRLYAAGDIDKYRGLIEKLLNEEDLTDAEWNQFANKVQIQKNFYYDLYYDETTGIEVPRQIKNAEFVLVPKLIRGTELEKVYNAMKTTGIDQLNTVETVKAAKHNVLELWDSDTGELLDDNLNNFIKDAPLKLENFSYNYLYRQQEVPQHLVDTENKAAVQIMKKIMDNLDTNTYPELDIYRNTIFKNYVANIKSSFNKVCAELGIEIKDGKVVLGDDNQVSLNRNVFFARFKENAAVQGVDNSLLEFFDLDANGFNNLPLFMSNVNSKLESIANSYFNNTITRQTISGWHAAQLADFGFKKIGENRKEGKKQITTNDKLQYRVEKELIINGKKQKVIVTEIMIPRWSNQLNEININNVPDELRTMIGYRIPTEGKQSMAIFYVKDFLPNANGSTVVVPDEWVTQTGSDFDVDSIYAMSKTFFKDKDNNFITYNFNRYSKDEKGYLNYLKDNVTKATKGALGKEAKDQLKKIEIRGSNIRIKEQYLEKQYKDELEKAQTRNLGIAYLNNVANYHNMLSYDEYLAVPVEEVSGQLARTNIIIENFINILNHPGAFEENSTTSNFENIKEANNAYSKLAKADKQTVAPSDFITQLDWFDAATSGIKLKGISVNRDSFNSISNVVKAYHNSGIKVIYNSSVITYNDAVARYGEENVRYINNKQLEITHKTIGWSNDNKNVEGYLVNPYGSQTTAHILDVMKEGAIHNENTYTFNAFKTITDFGSNYDTAIGFMWQPAIDRLTKKWKETNSIMSEGYSNPITESIRDIAIELNIDDKAKFAGRDDLLAMIDAKYEKLASQFGISSFTEAFSSPDLILNSDAYKSRLTRQMNGIQAHLFDLYVLAQFNRLNQIGQDISNNLNVLTADKYGAKQSFYATREVFNNATTVIDNTELYVNSSTGDKVTMLESIFPNVKEGIDKYLESDITTSTYPSLAAFLQMSSALSVKCCEEVFETASPAFFDFVYRIQDWTSNGKMTEQQYNDYKDHIINRAIVGDSASPFLVLPVTIVNNELVIPKEHIENSAQSRAIEIQRISGVRTDININDIIINDILDPTEEEVNKFAKLTPAQKVIFIKEKLVDTEINSAGIFKYVEANLNDERDNKKGVIFQYINYNQQNASTDEIHRLYRNALLSNHPFIRLAAIDIAKYAFIIEGHKFRTKNVSRLIDNTPLLSYFDKGLNIGEFASKAVNSYGFKNIEDNSDIINYIRKNYDTFRCSTYKMSYFAKKGISINMRPNGVIYMAGKIENSNILVNDKPRKIIRINKQLYIGGYSKGRLAYYPVDRLASFETYINYAPSTVLKNIHAPLNYLRAQEEDATTNINKIINSIREEIKNWNNNIKSVIKLNDKIDTSVDIIGLFKRNIINGNMYYTQVISDNNVPVNQYYIAVTGEKAINLSKQTAEYKKSYPAADNNDFATLVQITQQDINNVVTDQDISYSSINEQTPIGRALKNSVNIIQTAVRHDNKIARNVISGLSNAQVDYLNSEALTANAEFSTNLIADYIDTEASQLLDSINFFPCKDGINRPISDQQVISEVLNDQSKEDAFLNAIASANVFSKKYQLFKDIDLNTLDERTKELVEKINNVVNKVNANNVVRTARANWLKRWIALHSNNPNIIDGIMNELDAYGDTGLMDFWIQDVRANRNIILQTVLKEVSSRVEKGRIDGINEAKDFELKIKDIQARAKQQGKNATIDSVIDKDGRIIRPQNEEWQNKLNELNSIVDDVIIKYGKNSVEHLKAKYNRGKFISDTTVHRYLPIKVIGLDGNEFEMDYDNSLLYFDRYALENAPNEFAKYKQLTAKISDILNQATNNITTDEQDEMISSIYSEIDKMTSTMDDEGNPKIGPSLHIAEVLNNYNNGVRKVKENFFDKEVKAGFEAKLHEMQAIIAKYESNRDANGNLLVNTGELMKIREYRDAKNWMRKNTKYVVDLKDYENLQWALEELRDPTKVKSVYTSAVNNYQAKDEYGSVDGRKIPIEERAKIKNEVYRNFKYTKGNGLPYTGIIRSADDGDNVYKYSFYEMFTGNKTKSNEEIAIGENINTILEKYFDTANRTVKTYTIPIYELVGKTPVEEGNTQQLNLKQLFELLKQHTTKSDPIAAKRIAQFIESECDITYNIDRFIIDKAEAKAKGANYYAAWKEVFTELDKDGIEIPNRIIYGIIKPKDVNKWLDKDRTEAIRILRNNTREITTQYYYEELEEMRNQYGAESPEFAKWWNANHYYDPYTRTFKPLRIWTNLQLTDDSGTQLSGTFEPRINQMDVAPKKELVNPNYAKSGINKYIPGRGYDNPEYTKLNEFQHEIINEMNDIMQKYVFTSSNQKYVDEGYLPALPKANEITTIEAIKETFAFFGWSANVPTSDGWRNLEDFTFDKDYEVPNPMLRQLHNKTTQKLPSIPTDKNEGETDEEFNNRRKSAIEERNKIKAENDKVHSDIINRKWDEVLKAFIISSSRYNTIRTTKALLYNADQIINNNTAYDIRNGNISINRRTSSESETEYRQIQQKRTSDQLRNHIRRLVFEMYKENSSPKLLRLGSMMQNIAGSKYMMFNITGGIANVLTGSNNIMMERLAREYVNNKDWESAKMDWMKNSVSFMANMFSEESTTVQDAIVKLSNVVDFDRIIEANGVDGLREGLRKIRGLLFSPQAIGEHFMQNSMLFAMMKSHRLVPNNTGGYTIMSKEMYDRESDKLALVQVIEEDKELLDLYNLFMDNIKKDDKLRAKYNLFKSNPVYDFINSNLSKEQQKEYITARKKIKELKDKDFDKFDNIYDQFKLKDGIAKIKGDSKLTYKDYATFVDKVKEVNKKVHGVYDKLGAAYIEHTWYGGMLMQYHKHLYPGLKKRYRWNGYYNESLDSIEKGAYVSLIQFINTPFKNTTNDEIHSVSDFIKAFQNYGRSLLNFAVHVKLNYDILPENEKANIRRSTADFLYAGVAVMGAIALTGLCGDDDESIFYNLAMYSADRLASEALSFTPWGAYAEGEKLWSSPIAIQQTIEDMIGVAGNMAQLFINDGFLTEYTTGRYKGLNKFEVIGIRNIPVLRNIDRVLQMPQNNSYYKLNENILSIIPYKKISEDLFK